MKLIKTLFVLFIALTAIKSYAQIEYEKGYYINESDEKVEGLIHNLDWRNNPTEFDFKFSKNDKSETLSIYTVKEFGILNKLKYVKRSVEIDRSSTNLNILSDVRNPVFKEEELFLKVLVEGEATLYEYIESNLNRYFYKIAEPTIEQLVYKKFNNAENKVLINNRFRQQLYSDLECSTIDSKKFQQLEYTKSDLLNVFELFNKCSNSDYVIFEDSIERDLFNLSIRPRMNFSSASIVNNVADQTINFDSALSFGLGIEVEFIMPFNKSKWSVIFEPTYQSYQSEKTIDVTNVSGGKLVSTLDYKSIEIPIGVRHYFFLDKTSKLFLNASVVLDFDFSESGIVFRRADGSTLNSIEIGSPMNFAFGGGYNYNDKFSLELRLFTSRNILSKYLYRSADYNSFSLIFGYSFL